MEEKERENGDIALRVMGTNCIVGVNPESGKNGKLVLFMRFSCSYRTFCEAVRAYITAWSLKYISSLNHSCQFQVIAYRSTLETALKCVRCVHALLFLFKLLQFSCFLVLVLPTFDPHYSYKSRRRLNLIIN